MSNDAPEAVTHNKRRKKEASPSSSSGFLHSLPEALAKSCLARVSRLDHAALSLVSKTCRSMVLSSELYQTRSLTDYAEKFLYVCFCMPTDETPQVAPRDLHESASCFPQGPRGGWEDICVGRLYKHYSNWGEVFDPNTQTWADMPISKPVMEEKNYVVNSWDDGCYYYLLSLSKWEKGNQVSKRSKDWCLIDKLIYSCGNDGGIYWCEAGELDWCDAVGIDWREVLGLEFLSMALRESRVVHFDGKMVKVWGKIMYNISKNLEELLLETILTNLTNLGKNVLVFWEKLERGGDYMSLEIWCAEISLEKWEGGQIWGRCDWCHPILTIDLLTVDPLLCHFKVLYSIPVDV